MVDDGYKGWEVYTGTGGGIFGWLTLDNCSVTFCRRLYLCMACMGMGTAWDILSTMACCKIRAVHISRQVTSLLLLRRGRG